MSVFRYLRFIVHSGVRGVLRDRGRHLAAATAAGGMLLLVVLSLLGARSAIAAAAQLEDRVAVIAFVASTATRSDISDVEQRLTADARVRSVRYIGPDEALAMLRREAGADAFARLENSPLPAMLEVGLRDARAAEPIVGVLEADPAIESVVSEAALAERIAGVSRLALGIAAVIVLCSSIVAAVVIRSTLRLSIAARRQELRTMHLLGAGRVVLEAPLVIEAWITTLVGTAFALAALAGVLAAAAAGGIIVDTADVPALASGVAGVALLLGGLSARSAVRAERV